MSDMHDDGQRVARAISAAGVPVNSVYDLVNTSSPYPRAIPRLLELLAEGIQDERVAEGVVRALGVKEARGVAARPLIEAFRSARVDNWTYKWAIGNSLYAVADDTVAGDIVELVQDEHHGRAREMLVAALGRFRTPETTRVLIVLLDDPEVAAHAAKALGKQRAREARSALLRASQSGVTPLVQREATKSLALLE